MRPLAAPLPLDLAFAFALAAWWLAETGGKTGAAGTVALVLSTLPLAWRRTAPLATAVLCSAGVAVSGIPATPSEPLAQLAALLVATWSVAVHAPSRGATLAGLCALAVGGTVASLLIGDDLGFILILTGAAWSAGAAVRHQHDRSEQLEEQATALEERARAAAAEERERIARELHDVVSHTVSLMVVQAGAAQQLLRQDTDGAQRALGAVQVSGRTAVDDLRRMLGLLRGGDGTNSRGPQPGLDALDELLAAHETPVALSRRELPPLPDGIDLAAYRIVQEALTNARKHAQGCASSVSLGWDGTAVEIEVRTEAPPRAAAAGGTGHGIAGMSERVALYGGHFDAGRDERGDWVVHATLPLP
jgi:signal transduction histidine kinase